MFISITLMLRRCPFSLKNCHLFISVPWRFNVRKMSFICKILKLIYLHTINVKKMSFIWKISALVYLHTINVKKMSLIFKISLHIITVKRLTLAVKIRYLFICIPRRLNVKKMSFFCKILGPIYFAYHGG